MNSKIGYIFLGLLILLNGILTISQGMISLGLLIATEVDNNMKYIIGVPQIIVGIYIIYNSKEHEGSESFKT